MSLAATVLVPTFDHGPTLLCSVATALEQTVEDLEVFIVGDGVPAAARAVVETLLARDPRVRFFENTKGPRHGELYRHQALASARGRIVCYLSDDDLWLPDHVETMQDLLSRADLAHPLPLRIDPAGAVTTWTIDLALPFYRRMLLGGENRIPLSCTAHSLAMYRRLPFGWRTTPAGVPTDLYMVQQFLEHPACRCAGGARPTVLHFPSPERKGWTPEERLAELESWLARIRDPGWRQAFPGEILQAVVRERTGAEPVLSADLNYAQRDAEALRARVLALDEQAGAAAEERAAARAAWEEERAVLEAERQDALRAAEEGRRGLDEERAHFASAVAAAEAEVGRLRDRLDEVVATATWRLHDRLAASRLAAPLRLVARALAGRGGL